MPKMAIEKPEFSPLADRGPLGSWRTKVDMPGASEVSAILEDGAPSPHDLRMNDVSRHEMSAALAASEARVATIVESMRADAAELRAELREGNALIKAQGEIAKAGAERFQADADRFYADARTLLAESRTALSEIRLAGEQNKTAMMGLGYKVITWTLGTILAVGGVSIGAYNAIKRSPTTAPATTQATTKAAPETRPASQAPPAAHTPPPAEPAKQP